MNNEIDLIGELKTNDKKEEISKIEINLNKENKYYIRKNSNKSMGYNDKLSEIYFNKNEINNVIKDSVEIKPKKKITKKEESSDKDD